MRKAGGSTQASRAPAMPLTKVASAVDTVFKAVISVATVVAGVIYLATSWSDKRSREMLRATSVDALAKTVDARGGLTDRMAALEKLTSNLEHGQSSEYTARTESIAQLQKDLTALKPKTDTSETKPHP